MKLRYGVSQFFPYVIDLCFFHILHEKVELSPLQKVYYMKDMASFKNWFYSQVRLVDIAYYVPLLQNHNVYFHILMLLGNPTAKKQFNFLNPEFPKCIWPWDLFYFSP